MEARLLQTLYSKLLNISHSGTSGKPSITVDSTTVCGHLGNPKHTVDFHYWDALPATLARSLQSFNLGVPLSVMTDINFTHFFDRLSESRTASVGSLSQRLA
jgi:hypothetical protein